MKHLLLFERSHSNKETESAISLVATSYGRDVCLLPWVWCRVHLGWIVVFRR